MMLYEIELLLDYEETERLYGSAFDFRSRYVANFLRRSIKPLRYPTEGFNGIFVRGCARPDPISKIVPSAKALDVPIFFDRARYDSLAPGEHHEFFLGMLREGFDKCNRTHKIPYAELLAAMDEFRRGGYKNEWVHQTRNLRSLGIQASLFCSLDSERFTLILQLSRKKQTIFHEQILETKPSELCFDYLIKELVLEGDSLVLKAKISKPTFTLDMRPFMLAG